MGAEERNFRNQYYDKMGFRVVEEKKSLESMLSSDTIDVKKMTHFCLRFSLPIVTRPLVWKVLLTVLPPHRENHEFVYEMRCQQFDQLIACLRLLDLAEPEINVVVEAAAAVSAAAASAATASAAVSAVSAAAAVAESEKTSAGRSNNRRNSILGSTNVNANGNVSKKSLTFLQMYLLEEGKLCFGESDLLSFRENQIFVRIADTMAEIYDDDKDAFFTAVCFFKILATKYEDVFYLLPDCLIKLLKQLEGDDGRYLKHLHQAQIFRHIPYNFWFRGCFAGVIPSIALDKIWDKVIAGSCLILVHVAAAILLTMKRPLLTMKNGEQMIQFLSTIPSDSAEMIVSKALESWYKSPALVPIIAKEDSPVIIERVPS